MREAADKGSHTCRAYSRRIWKACVTTPGFPGDIFPNSYGSEHLEHYAIRESRLAYEEYLSYHRANKSKLGQVTRLFTDAWAGVGANWFEDQEMLNGYTQSQWIKDDWLMERVRESTVPPCQLFINKRGDTVLHFTAMAGQRKPFKKLIKEYGVDINIRNGQGETPLLCSARAGQGGIVILCLKNYGADVSLTSRSGETALHWLVSHDNAYIPYIVRYLMSNGARIDAHTHQRVNHSQFNGSIDVEFQLPGTALSWTVHNNRPKVVQVLSSHGADPNWNNAIGAIQSPLLWSACFHYHECLKHMIEHLESLVTVRTSDGNIDKRHATFFGPLVSKAVDAADRFSMVIRGGSEYLNHLHKTLDLLREKTRFINFQTDARFEGSLLRYAVLQGQHDVVKYMFDRKWLVDTINDPCGSANMSPLLEAVRWNRLETCQLLWNNGAAVDALASNPLMSDVRNWSALHVLAFEGHNKDLALVDALVEKGVPADGPPSAPATCCPSDSRNTWLDQAFASLSMHSESRGSTKRLQPCETPFTVALRRNAFHLCTRLRTLGADVNALCMSAGLVACPHPLTVLGHVIISNMRWSAARPNYLLDNEDVPADLIVEPSRRLSALHRAAMAYRDVYRVSGEAIAAEEHDFDTSEEIMYELLLKWNDPEQLDAKCAIHDSTALHLAVESTNLSAVVSLLRAGASDEIRNRYNQSPGMLAQNLIATSDRARRTAQLLPPRGMPTSNYL